MGRAVDFINDPLGIVPDDIQEAAFDPLHLIEGGEGQQIQSAGKESAGASATNTGPTPLPYRRPRAAPLTAEQLALDRRRSIASAMRRRRAASSILGGTSPAADPLGG